MILKHAFDKASKHLSFWKCVSTFTKITINLMTNILDKIIQDKKESLKI